MGASIFRGGWAPKPMEMLLFWALPPWMRPVHPWFLIQVPHGSDCKGAEALDTPWVTSSLDPLDQDRLAVPARKLIFKFLFSNTEPCRWADRANGFRLPFVLINPCLYMFTGWAYRCPFNPKEMIGRCEIGHLVVWSQRANRIPFAAESPLKLRTRPKSKWFSHWERCTAISTTLTFSQTIKYSEEIFLSSVFGHVWTAPFPEARRNTRRSQLLILAWNWTVLACSGATHFMFFCEDLPHGGATKLTSATSSPRAFNIRFTGACTMDSPKFQGHLLFHGINADHLIVTFWNHALFFHGNACMTRSNLVQTCLQNEGLIVVAYWHLIFLQWSGCWWSHLPIITSANSSCDKMTWRSNHGRASSYQRRMTPDTFGAIFVNRWHSVSSDLRTYPLWRVRFSTGMFAGRLLDWTWNFCWAFFFALLIFSPSCGNGMRNASANCVSPSRFFATSFWPRILETALAPAPFKMESLKIRHSFKSAPWDMRKDANPFFCWILSSCWLLAGPPSRKAPTNVMTAVVLSPGPHLG